ncbi:MAG: N-acetyltransferase [Oscillospiraceae bacterium]|nr:N-acetyltransferase [Oscillospiraceae bacterium]
MIRIAVEADVPAMLDIYAPYVENTTYSFEYDVPCRKTFLQRFYTVTAQFPWLVWEEDGRVLGYAYASAPFERAAYRWCAEPSIYLCPDAQGMGIAGQLYAALEAILLEQGYQVLYALITGENTASLRFHEKMGYRTRVTLPDCGFKHGRWLGLVWMEKRLKIVETPSAFPRSWLSIVQDAERFRNILDSLSLS